MNYITVITSGIDPPTGSGYSSGATDIPLFIQNILNAIVTIGGIAFFIYTLYGGIMYLTSAGDEKNLEKAKKTLSHGFIGMVVLSVGAILANIVGTILGIDIFNLYFGN